MNFYANVLSIEPFIIQFNNLNNNPALNEEQLGCNLENFRYFRLYTHRIKIGYIKFPGLISKPEDCHCLING